MDKGNDTVRVEHQDLTTVAPDHRPEILREYSPEQLRDIEKKLVRKLDYRCLPILIFLFLLNILDRNAIANARLGGLEEDLGLSDGKSWHPSLFSLARIDISTEQCMSTML